MYNYRVIFKSAIIIVSASDAEEAQEKAIEQMEDACRAHDEIVGIVRVNIA